VLLRKAPVSKFKFPKKVAEKNKKEKKLKVKFWNEKHNKASHRVEERGVEHVGDGALLAAVDWKYLAHTDEEEFTRIFLCFFDSGPPCKIPSKYGFFYFVSNYYSDVFLCTISIL